MRRELGLRGGPCFCAGEQKQSFVCVQGSASPSLAHVRWALGARLGSRAALTHRGSPAKPGRAVLNSPKPPRGHFMLLSPPQWVPKEPELSPSRNQLGQGRAGVCCGISDNQGSANRNVWGL